MHAVALRRPLFCQRDEMIPDERRTAAAFSRPAATVPLLFHIQYLQYFPHLSYRGVLCLGGGRIGYETAPEYEQGGAVHANVIVGG